MPHHRKVNLYISVLENLCWNTEISRNLVERARKSNRHVFDLQDTTEEEDEIANDDEAKKGRDNPALEVDEKWLESFKKKI